MGDKLFGKTVLVLGFPQDHPIFLWLRKERAEIWKLGDPDRADVIVCHINLLQGNYQLTTSTPIVVFTPCYQVTSDQIRRIEEQGVFALFAVLSSDQMEKFIQDLAAVAA